MLGLYGLNFNSDLQYLQSPPQALVNPSKLLLLLL